MLTIVSMHATGVMLVLHRVLPALASLHHGVSVIVDKITTSVMHVQQAASIVIQSHLRVSVDGNTPRVGTLVRQVAPHQMLHNLLLFPDPPLLPSLHALLPLLSRLHSGAALLANLLAILSVRLCVDAVIKSRLLPVLQMDVVSAPVIVQVGTVAWMSCNVLIKVEPIMDGVMSVETAQRAAGSLHQVLPLATPLLHKGVLVIPRLTPPLNYLNPIPHLPILKLHQGTLAITLDILLLVSLNPALAQLL